MTDELQSLKDDNARIKQWNKQFYTMMHEYFFGCLENWKRMPAGSSMKKEATIKCRDKEREIMVYMTHIDVLMQCKGVSIPAMADKEAEQTEINYEY